MRAIHLPAFLLLAWVGCGAAPEEAQTVEVPTASTSRTETPASKSTEQGSRTTGPAARPSCCMCDSALQACIDEGHTLAFCREQTKNCFHWCLWPRTPCE